MAGNSIGQVFRITTAGESHGPANVVIIDGVPSGISLNQDDFNYQLTLSGHTHGLQFGIEIPGFFRWSPSQYVYKQWAGLYEEFGRYVNVNRGFGYHAFPGRVGIWPEITVIELKKA